MADQVAQEITKHWFGSKYYHLLYGYRDEKEAESFIKETLKKLKIKKGARVLDVACGNGRHAIQLSKLGYDVIGFDLNASNIAEAKNYRNSSLIFIQHDMLEPFTFGKFDLVVNLFTSFGYFDDDQKHLKALMHMASALSSDGQFILDYLNAEKVIRDLKKSDIKEIEDYRFDIKRWIADGYIQKEIKITNISETEQPVQTAIEKVRAFTLNDFNDLFAQVGLRIKTAYGDYKLNPFDSKESERLIIVAEPLKNS